MTDKQVIIDVTECPYYMEGKFCSYLSYKTKCEGDCNWTAYKEMEEQLDILLENNLSLRKVLSDIEHIAEENKDTLQYRGICLSILEKIRSV